jgi:hypothetical protein
MTDSKIYNVLTYFDKVEQNRLRKYIRSPYFNANEALMDFYDILTEHINANGKASPLTKEIIWTQLYKNETFNDVRFRKLSSDLLKLVEGFLAQQIYDDNNLQKVNFLLEAINEKKIEYLYNSATKQAQILSNISNQKPSSYYYHQFEIQKKLYNLNEAELKRFEKSNVEEIINNLDYFYLAEKLKWYINILSRQNLISHEYQLLFIDEIISHINKYTYENVPLIRIYYLTFLTQTANNEEHYFALKDLLFKYRKTLPLKDAEEAYITMFSYCIKKMNQGNAEFYSEFLSLSKDLLKTDILLASGELNPWYFRNAVMASLRLNEYEWAEQFINDYENKLPSDFRKSAVSYNRALVYFYQKKYDKVIPLLQSVEYDELVYNLSSKSILLAVYYELDADEALNSLMESFKTFLNRHKEISDIQRTLYTNLMKYIKKLLKLIPGDQKEITKIKQEMEDDKKVGIASMKWVYEKLAELE